MIPRSPFEAAPDTMTRVQLTAIFEDWEHHVVPEEFRRIRVTHDWHSMEGYVTWFYRVSHPLLTPDAPTLLGQHTRRSWRTSRPRMTTPLISCRSANR